MKKIFKISILIIASVAIGSCDDFLTIESDSQLTYDTFYKSYDDCRSATAVLYSAPWFDFNGSFMWEIGDSRANNMYIDLATYASGIFNRFMENSSTDHLDNGWDSFYNVVCQSDHIINNLYRAEDNGVNAEQVAQCRAEARFMRGTAYWYLLSLWGNVPIIEDPVKLTSDYQTAPNCREDVLMYAITDLEYASHNLPSSDVPGRVTRFSALGMLSRLYITAACYARGGKFTPDRYNNDPEYWYDLAYDAALEVCENGLQYFLMSDYEQIFRPQNNNCSEMLFALQWVPGSLEYGVGNRIQTNLCYNANILGGLKAYGGSGYISAELIELMHTRGETSRMRATAFVNGAVYGYIGTASDAGQWKVTGRSMCNVKKQVVGGTLDTDGAAVDGNSGFNTPMLRLSEVYLLLAEAAMGTAESLMSRGQKGRIALEYFNRVHRRAANASSTTDYSDVSLNDIWTERRIELAMEGQFWYDIVRRAYWDEDWVINYLNSQHRGYKYKYDGKTFTWRDSDGREARMADASVLLLPYPSTELTQNPKLNDQPIHFEVER